MAVQTRDTHKSRYITARVPPQAEYHDVFDSYAHVGENQIRNVKEPEFGAVGNGNEADDDQPAIQAAIDSGADVFIPPGTYFLGAPLTFDLTPPGSCRFASTVPVPTV